MMTRISVATVLTSLLVLAIPAHADPVFTASGTYLFGSPVAYLAMDACGNGGLTDGIDSSCVAFPADFSGLPFTVTGTAEFYSCFYDAEGAFIDCPVDGKVSPGAAMIAIASLGGTNVAWTLTVG